MLVFMQTGASTKLKKEKKNNQETFYDQKRTTTKVGSDFRTGKDKKDVRISWGKEREDFKKTTKQIKSLSASDQTWYSHHHEKLKIQKGLYKREISLLSFSYWFFLFFPNLT